MSKTKKPPLGIVPNYLFEERIEKEIHRQGGMSEERLYKIRQGRIKVITLAMRRFTHANLALPIVWIFEYNQLQSRNKKTQL